MPPKRKKRFHGLYYHSSPPRVLPMNGQGSSETKKKSADDFSVRLSTIRIWMHEKDIGKLTRVLWAGQGNRLRQQASTNPRVKRFLAAVPYVMNTIKDVHQSVVDNSLETLQATMEPPVPPSLITSKDLNGLNVIHKAAGLGHTMVLEYLLGIWPNGAHETDMTGKTPLHWAASAKNNMRCYTLLTQAGCEEDALDYKMKTPAYYKQKHNEIERSFLTLVPEAPRVSQDIPTDWDALASDDTDERKKPEIKIPNGRRMSDIIGNGMNLLTSRSEANSIENTSEPDLFEGDKSTEDASEAQPPEPVVNGKEEENPPEDSHLEDEPGVGEHSEPPSPPKTPGEKTEENLDGDEENGRVIYEPAPPPTPPLQEEENDSIALSDHNNDDTNENKEDAEDGDEKNNDANGDSNEIDKSEGEGGNVDEGEDGEDQKDGGVSAGDDDVDTKRDLGDKEEENDENLEEDEVQGEEEKENERENDERDSTSKIDDNIEREKMEEQDDVENDDETHSVNDNEDKSEETGENINESEVKDEEATEEENDHTSETEQENETESTPLEDAEPVEEDTGNTENLERPKTQDDSQPVEADTENLERPKTQDDSYTVEADTENAENLERPKTQDEFASKQNEVSPQTPATESPSDDERKAKSVEPKLNKPQEPQKETDDDDDAQDAGSNETLPEPPTETEPEMDENENIPEFDDKMATDSPTSSLAIEGYVLGDSEDNQVQSESAAILDDEEKYVKAIIDAGDMEQLAALVLNGDGKKILNRTSSQPEIQAFLNNVPAYMSKISRVHEAARQGTLYQLQSALDRRKFAIAKDAMSPCGASPLHVAVLFGHADIVRYLAGRFPETTSAVDDDGRTPLHYAATIKDNGHFFNLLSHLGGNPRAADKLGHTADFYTNAEEAKDILTYKILLQRFGAETLEDEMLSDQGLGDPLIKGLTEIAEKRPADPVAYLAGFLQNYMRSRKGDRNNDTGDTNSTALVNSDPEIPTSPTKTNGIDAAPVEERFSSPESTPKNEDRDEHGQSMLHFACARSHRRNGLLNLIEESQIDVTYRDELYRTARDVSLQANQPGNAKEIDRYVLSLAVVGDTKPFESMAIAGYDHIMDVIDDEGVSIVEVAETRGHSKLVEFLNDLRNLEEMREELHQAIRDGDFEKVKEITSSPDGKWLIKAKNYYGRTAMHIAVLKELEEMVEYFVNTCPDALKCGDNLERTPLHYAMGTNAVEGISRILIRKGAKRTMKDLKGRQPSYYFINKADIMRLQEEEDENH